MRSAASIEFFKNLALYEYEGFVYDFHNEYVLERIIFVDKKLKMSFKKENNTNTISIIFLDVGITSFEFFNSEGIEGLTLDTLYRGRCEYNGRLMDISEDGRGYFYAEFYEGQKIEFWTLGFTFEF